MTSAELQVKYDAAEEKVEKRKNTIIKACKKAGINPDDVFNAYYSFVTNYKADYLREKEARALLDGIVDTVGKYYDDPETQILESLPKLYDVERVAYNWKVKLDIEKNKESAPKIQVLVDFLNEWGERAKEYYRRQAKMYVEFLNNFHDVAYDFLMDSDADKMSWNEKRAFVETFNNYMRNTLGVKNRYSFGTIDAKMYADPKVDGIARELACVGFDRTNNNFDQVFGYSMDAGNYYLKSIDESKLERMIEDEKKRKYEDLCNRISAVVGEITNVNALYIGNKEGELNGVVEGTKGSARVETIGAGGYNIQVFHYRVLVKRLG